MLKMGMLKRFFVFAIILVALYLFAVNYDFIKGQITGKAVDGSSNTGSDYERESAFILRAVDGDTIVTDKGEVRLLGINTPEKKRYYYLEAKNFLAGFENKSVEILRDDEDVDKYSRKLRYVFYEGRLLNVEILEKGLATSFMLSELKYEEKLRTAEEFAMDNRAGLWERSSDKCAGCIALSELNAEEEFFVIENICDFDCDLDGWEVKDDANHFFKLEDLNGHENQTYASDIKVWNDDADRFFMRDESGMLVVFYEY